MSESFEITTSSRANRRFVDFVSRRPLWSVLLGLLLFVALASGIPKLRADFTHRGFFAADDPKLLRFEGFERRFGNDDVITVAVESPSGIFDPESATLLGELTEKMWQIPDVVRVESLSNFNWVHASGDDIRVEPLLGAHVPEEALPERRKVALGHEVLPNYLVSSDGTVAMLYAYMRPNFEKQPNAATITHAAREIVTSFRRGDHAIYLTGGPPVTYAFEEANKADARLLPIALLIATVVLIGLLRNAFGVGLSLLVVLLSTAATFGAAGHLGLVQMALTMTVPSILICVGIADTVHPLVSFVTALRNGVTRGDAARHALSTNLLATFLTSLTTAVGFFSFASSNLKPIVSLGVMAGIGTMLTWLLTQLLVGGLLFVLPFRAGRLPDQKRMEQRWAKALADFVERRRWSIAVGAAAASLGACLYAVGVDINTDPMQYFRPNASVREANDFIERRLGSARSFEFELGSGQADGAKDPSFLRKVDALEHWIEQQPGITRAVSVLSVLKATNRALNGDDPSKYAIPETQAEVAQQLLLYTLNLPQGTDLNDRVTVENDAIRLTVLNRIGASSAAVATVRLIEAKARELGLDAHGTGKYFLYQDTQDYVVHTFLTSLWSANLVIGALMVVFLRSLKLAVISMIPNVLPLFAAGALLRVIGQPLDMGTVLVASVTLGISVDDTCHLLVSYSRSRRRLPPRAALEEALTHSGKALLSTNAILILAFASFATASFVPNVYFGLLTSFALVVALLADALLTPALLLIGARGVAPAAAPQPIPAQ